MTFSGYCFLQGSTKISDYKITPNPRFAKKSLQNPDFEAIYRFSVNSYHTSAVVKSRVEPFDCARAIFFRDQTRGLSAVICMLLRRVWHLYHVFIISLGSFQYCKICFKLSKYWLWKDKVWNTPWACTLYSIYIMMPCPDVWLGRLELLTCTENVASWQV